MRVSLLMLLTVLTASCEDERCFEAQTDTVVAVGGCDRHGICGVITSRGYYPHFQYPVVGQTISFNVQVECVK